MERATHESPIPELPSLDPGVTLLDAPDKTSGVLPSLVLDHLLTSGGQGRGSARWIDARSEAQTTPFTRLAPARRVLDRIQVARGVTAYQHFSLVETLEATFECEPERASEISLIVMPSIDWQYRSEDLHEGQAEQLFSAVLDRLDSIAHTYDVPVLLTRTRADSLTEPVDSILDRTLTCERTRFGPRFVGDDFETLVYPAGNGTLQTTLAFWERVLSARADALSEPASGETGREQATTLGVSDIGAY